MGAESIQRTAAVRKGEPAGADCPVAFPQYTPGRAAPQENPTPSAKHRHRVPDAVHMSTVGVAWGNRAVPCGCEMRSRPRRPERPACRRITPVRRTRVRSAVNTVGSTPRTHFDAGPKHRIRCGRHRVGPPDACRRMTAQWIHRFAGLMPLLPVNKPVFRTGQPAGLPRYRRSDRSPVPESGTRESGVLPRRVGRLGPGARAKSGTTAHQGKCPGKVGSRRLFTFQGARSTRADSVAGQTPGPVPARQQGAARSLTRRD